MAGIEIWDYRSSLVNSPADFSSSIEYQIQVVVPDGYPEKGLYPVMFIGPVEGSPASYGDGLKVAKSLNVHNERQCILVSMTTKASQWYGPRSDGSSEIDVFLLNCLFPFVDQKYQTIKERNSRLWLGFSKSGWGGLSMMLRHPESIGYFAGWDVPWTQPYSVFGPSYFGSPSLWANYNPQSIIGSCLETINDKKRVWIGAGHLWNSDYENMSKVLTGLNVDFLSAFAETGVHDWLTPWMSVAVGALFTMRSG